MLTFDKESHAYYLDGRRVPSVTQVLTAAHLIDYTFLPEYVRDNALDRGTKVHAATRAYDEITGNEVVPLQDLDWPDLPDSVRPYLEAYISFRIATGFVPLENELRGYISGIDVAGTLDLIGKMPDGRLLLIDHKSGGHQPSAALQTAPYAEFDIVKRYYPVLERHSLTLKNDGRYVFSEPFTDPWDLNTFNSAVNVYRWKERNRLL